ncbi:MAG: glycosyltransferase family 39 protein, partial [Patescibacteria group bacterium]
MFDIYKIFTFFKKNFNRKDIFLGLGLVALFFLTRIIFLDKLPIFSDEGIYIHWARIAWHDASWRFISLTDGRQPLQTWGTIPFLKLFPQNLLFGGRMFSVATGFVSLIGIFSLLFYLFNKKTAFLGAFLYIFTPFFLFYDRIALADSAVNAGFIWILFFSILVVRTLRLDLALLFGITAGMAMLTKSSVRMFIMLSA